MQNFLLKAMMERNDTIEEQNSIVRNAEEEYASKISPLIKENVDFDTFCRIDVGIGRLIWKLHIGCYLDGVRDLIELLAFHGDADDI